MCPVRRPFALGAVSVYVLRALDTPVQDGVRLVMLEIGALSSHVTSGIYP